jgi:cell wall-associated NlpC family hydrolase
MRVLGVAVAMAAVAGFGPGSAAADPAPTTAADALEQYRQLSEQASELNEDLLAARTNLTAKQNDLRQASGDLATAGTNLEKAQEAQNQFRGRVDDLTAASLQGARFNEISALLTGDSPKDFLDRAVALRVIAADNTEALDQLGTAVDQADKARESATSAQRRSQEATDAAARITSEIEKRKQALDQQIGQVKQALDRLSVKDKAKLADPGDQGTFFGPPGSANTVIQAALSQRGKPYVWAADGPDSYDCSGLTLWAYAKVGIKLPHSSRIQYTMGRAVARNQWVAGDLLFYGSNAGSIHHVVMYIGDGKIVHASTAGTPVKVDSVAGGGRDYFGARRYLG